jgi:hypothetical protein
MTRRPSHHTPRLWLLALSLSSLSSLALAMPGAMAASGHHGAHAPHSGDHGGMQARQARPLDALKGKLQLTTAQESAWSAFAAAMQLRPAPAQNMAQQQQELQRLSAPERLDRMKELRGQRQAQMSAMMDQRSEATKRLYATLSAEQKKVFDDETARHMHGQGRHGDGPHRHGGHGLHRGQG